LLDGFTDAIWQYPVDSDCGRVSEEGTGLRDLGERGRISHEPRAVRLKDRAATVDCFLDATGGGADFETGRDRGRGHGRQIPHGLRACVAMARGYRCVIVGWPTIGGRETTKLIEALGCANCATGRARYPYIKPESVPKKCRATCRQGFSDRIWANHSNQ